MSVPVEVHEQSWPSRIGAAVGVGFAAGAGALGWGRQAWTTVDWLPLARWRRSRHIALRCVEHGLRLPVAP